MPVEMADAEWQQTYEEIAAEERGERRRPKGAVFPRFTVEPKFNRLKTYGGIKYKKDGSKEQVEPAGRPIYDDVVFIEIVTPGDKLNTPKRPMRAHDRKRFAVEYARWEAQGRGDGPLTGTPLKEWPLISRSQVEELAYFKVRTVEELASTSDGNMQTLGAHYSVLRDRAREYLEKAKQGTSRAHMETELAKRDALIAELLSKVNALTGANDNAEVAANDDRETPAGKPVTWTPEEVTPAEAPKRRGRRKAATNGD